MDKEVLRQRLMVTFLGELEEHVQSLNRDLLALEKDSGDRRADLLVSLFRTAHSLKGAARSVSVEPIESACHRLENLLGPARDGERPLDPETIQLVYATADALAEAGERLRTRQDLSTGPLVSLLPSLDSAAGRSPARPPARARKPVTAAPAPAPAPALLEGFVRVPAQKLDTLVADSGELLIARRRFAAGLDDVAQLHGELRDWRSEWLQIDEPIRRMLASNAPQLPRRVRSVLESAASRVKALERQAELLSSRMTTEYHAFERAATTLEDGIRLVRLLPFSHACEGLERTVRDLAHTIDKKVTLSIEGGHIELDRVVLEGLKDPLLHLIRNAVDHGIESPDERRAAGKAPDGHVVVEARLRGGAVEILVADDGRGLDLDEIRAQAGRRNLSAPEDDREAARLVFAPGFSTVRSVSRLSGRGMGLDVVRHQVESLHGQVDISFQPGQGTRVVMTVPLTVTTIRALLLGAANQVFALPIAHVRRLIRAGRADLGSAGGREVLLSEGAPIPIVVLTDLLGIRDAPVPEHPGRRAPLVVVASGNTQAALVVDELIAEDEILVKSLGTRMRRVRHLSGATILPSGRVALILNAADLLASAVRRTANRTLADILTPREPETKRRLLIADDSVTTRSLEKSILEAAGYEVTAAADGSDAWRLLQERGADLVVADVEMPRMDGFALCEAIRQSPRFRALPIVLVTALDREADRARGLAAGANAYLPKTAFDQRELLDTIAQLL